MFINPTLLNFTNVEITAANINRNVIVAITGDSAQTRVLIEVTERIKFISPDRQLAFKVIHASLSSARVQMIPSTIWADSAAALHSKSLPRSAHSGIPIRRPHFSIYSKILSIFNLNILVLSNHLSNIYQLVFPYI